VVVVVVVEMGTVYLVEAEVERVDAMARAVVWAQTIKEMPVEMYLAPFEVVVAVAVRPTQEATLQVTLQVQGVRVKRPQFLAGLAPSVVRAGLGPQHLLQLRER
jgi:hypothetical protein